MKPKIIFAVLLTLFLGTTAGSIAQVSGEKDAEGRMDANRMDRSYHGHRRHSMHHNSHSRHYGSGHGHKHHRGNKHGHHHHGMNRH